MKKAFIYTILQFVLIVSCFPQKQSAKNEDIETKINRLIQQMTLEEKASLCSGRDSWSTKPIDRLGIPWVWVSDGPHGLRCPAATNLSGYGDQIPATCFPTASALAATWNTDLIYKVGQTLGEESHALNVNVLLGPGVNIKRHPLGGRNFEFFSEDPILAGELSAAYINGVQSQGVGTSLKHFALNNEEYMRMLTSSDVDERTMREIYLVPFEIAVKKAAPWTVMASYNRINGVYGTQTKFLLTDILRNEWGFKGIVISDWVSVIDRVEGLKAGMNIEMPESGGINDAIVLQAVKNGQLDEKVLDENVRQILRFAFKAKALHKDGVKIKVKEDHEFARKVASEAITLLKNDNQLLPITEKYKTIAIIGEFAKKPRCQTNGSSEVLPTMVDTTLNEIIAHAGKKYKIVYAQGYSLSNPMDFSMIENAKKMAAQADIAIVFAGLPLSYESEGIDRHHMNMPESHDKLIHEIAAVQTNTAVVITSGSVVAMPWNKEVKTIVDTWLPGQAGAGAIADVLFGNVNPSGKVAETFPVRLKDSPAYLNFPGENREVLYGERFYVGYRYYDAKDIDPLFPFGHGLSFTTFEYSGITTSAKTFTDKELLTVSAKIKNTGKMAGKEVVQLYVGDKQSSVPRPVKELKKFVKVDLQPGEAKEVKFELNSRDFSYYDPSRKMWIAESGDFDILMGSSSRDIRQSQTVTLNSMQKLPNTYDEYTFLSEFLANTKTKALALEYFKGWLKSIADNGQSTDDFDHFRINPFFMDMPLIKYPYITKGMVTKEKVYEFLKKAKEIDN